MNKLEFIDFILNNNGIYQETNKEVEITIYREEEFYQSLSFDKEDKKIHLFLNENGSGKSHDIDYFEMEVINYFKSLIEKSDEDEK